MAQGSGSGLRILISGGTGFIGTELVRQLEASGHAISKLVRRPVRASNEISWNPARRELAPSAFDGIDVVINLSGVSTGRLPWTPRYEKQILQSRIDTSATIADTLSALAIAPATFINASGVAFYGDRPGEELDEESARGTGFLADVAVAWEAAAHRAPTKTRVVTIRTGLVTGRGGAFTPLLLLTRFGLASRLGSGAQFWPWIGLHDEAAAIVHLLTSSISGPVNLVGPTPATSAEVTRELARALHRWHVFAIPTWLVRTMLGKAGTELLLPSQKISPERLLADGFVFRDNTVAQAIERNIVAG